MRMFKRKVGQNMLFVLTHLVQGKQMIKLCPDPLKR